MSKETREKIRQARRNRVKQPREGQSKKERSLYSVIEKDYGKLAKTNKEVKEWLKKNKKKLKEMDSSEYGILNDYTEMYISWREFKMDKVLFGKNAANLEHNLLAEDNYEFMEEEDIDEEYEELIADDFYIEYD